MWRKCHFTSFLLFLLLFLSVLSPPLLSGEPPSDTLNSRGRGDIFWNATETHYITKDFLVPVGDSLIIEAGTSVVFEGPYSIFVEGSLIASGNESDSILFTSGMDYKKPGDWGSIQFNATSNDTSVLSHVLIEYAQIGVRCEGSSPAVLNGNITKSLYSGIYARDSNMRIENNSITGNLGQGIHAVGSNLTIRDNVISENSYNGILALSSSSLQVNGNDLMSNGYDGVHIGSTSDAILSENNITFNGHSGAFLGQNSYVSLISNNITDNSWYGVLSDRSFSDIDGNVISDNGKPLGFSGVYLLKSSSNITGNLVAGSRGDGIVLDGSTGEIMNNSIISNEAGIRLHRSSPLISGNNPIEGNQYGMYVEESSPIVTGNVLRNNIYGVYSVNSSDLVIKDNVITNAQGRDLVVGDEYGNVIQYYNNGESRYSRIGPLRTTDRAKIDAGLSAYPSSVDLDGDGRQDLVVGNQQGFFRYFRNTGDGYEDMGLLTNRTPIADLKVESYAHPFVVDYDSDGDLDLFIGQGDGNISYFENDGEGIFIFKWLLNLDGVDLGSMAAPYLEQWIGDEDLDLVAGGADGDLGYWAGTDADKPLFVGLGFMKYQNDSTKIFVPTNSSPLYVYWNNDTVFDLIVGDGEGNLSYYEGESNTTFKTGVPVRLSSGPTLNVSRNSVPALGDWNKDGFGDIILGGDDGFVLYCENAGNNTFRNPMRFRDSGGDIRLGNWSAPFVVDWNVDGVFDLVVGDAEGNLTLFLGTEPGNVNLSDGRLLQTKGQPTYITTLGWSAPAFVDWNNDGDFDLIAGGSNGTISYYENDGTNEFVFQWNLSSELSELDVGFRSAPSLVDWDSNGTLDLLVGDLDGYVHRFERIEGDLRDLKNWGKMVADGSPILVGERSVPCPSDLDEDGDLDLLVGDNSGLVHRFEREDGLLYYRGYLRSDSQNLTVDGFSAPLILGWESSSTDYEIMNGMHFENTTATIVDNDVIRGGGGGYAIYASNSSIVIDNNGWVAGGKGLYGGGTNNKSSSGGQGILAWESSIFLSRTKVQGGDGSDTSTQNLEGGDGGIGIEVKGGGLKVLNSSVGGGAGRTGILTRGVDGVGISIQDIAGVFTDSSSIRGRTAFLVSNTSIYLRNSHVSSIEHSFDLGNTSTAVSMNTSFDKSKVLLRDLLSTMTVGWHLDVLALDNFSNPVPKANLTVWPATFTSMGELNLNPAISGYASPVVANLTLPTSVDLLVGDATGNVSHYKWNAGQFVYNGTLNKPGGVPVGVPGPCSPFLADWNGDEKLDLFLGAGNGTISFFNNSGNGIFNDSFFLRLEGGTPINVSDDAVPRIIDWDQDGDVDLIAGGNGYITYFENNGSDYFLPGVRLNADGSEIRHGSWSSPLLTDFDLDGLTDLLVGTSNGLALLYLNASNEFRLGGHLKTNNSLLHDIDVGNRSVIATMDVNGDGYQDLLVGNSDGEILWFMSNRYAGNVSLYTDLDGYAIGIPVVEYEQRDINGDTDGEDEGERTYLSPSGIVASRCGGVGNAAPLPYLEEYLSITIQMNIDVSACPPIVHSTFPYQGQKDVPVSSDIIITFDKEMDTSSVNGSLSYAPPLFDTPNWLSNRTVQLDVGTKKFNTEYTVTISGNIANDTFGRGLDGNTNGTSDGSPDDDFVFRFTTESIPRVTSHNPDGPGQPTESVVSVCFNKSMNKSSVEQLLTIIPSVEMTFWWDWKGTCLYADGDLEFGTTYTLTISGDATDINGNTLDGNGDGILQGGDVDKYEWQFSTVTDSILPQVVSTFPTNGQEQVDLDIIITVDFTEQISSDSLRTGLVADGDDFVWDAGIEPGHIPLQDFGIFSINGNVLTISQASLEYKTTYWFTLSGNTATGLKDLAGNPLDGNENGTAEGSPADDYVFTFTTVDPVPPKVVFTFPTHGQMDVPLEVTIRAIFDDEMDARTLNDSTVLLMDPYHTSIDVNASYSPSNNTLLLTPENRLNYSTTYEVVISAEVRDTSQNPLDGNGDGIGGDEFVWNFTTVPDVSPPSLQILSPGNNTLFTIGDVVNISGIATDSDRIDRLEIKIQFGNWRDIFGSLNEADDSWFYEWRTQGQVAGEYRIQVRATDPSNLTTTDEIIIRLQEPVTPYPLWIPALITIIILVSATFSYRYFRSTQTERDKVAEQRKAELEEMLKKLDEEHETLAKRAREIEAKEMDLETKEIYLRDLDSHYQSLAQSLFERERIDISAGERIVAQEMGENLHEIKRHEKAYILLSEAEASEAGEMTKKLPESGKKALLLVYFNALEAYLRDKLREMIPSGATILLGERGHINTRSRGWEEKWSALSLGTLTHAIDHNMHFFVEDEEQWEETQRLMRETIDIRNSTAHPSEANPDVLDVREKVYSAIQSLSEILKRPRKLKR